MPSVRPLTQFVIDTVLRKVEEQNHTRRTLGLTPIVPKERSCLCCSSTFLSFNEKRLCRSCTHKASQE